MQAGNAVCRLNAERMSRADQMNVVQAESVFNLRAEYALKYQNSIFWFERASRESSKTEPRPSFCMEFRPKCNGRGIRPQRLEN